MDEGNTPAPASSSSGRKSQITSCAECRRLKLRCDRVFPCSSCIRRGCANLCPTGTLEKGKRGFLKRLEQSLPAHHHNGDTDSPQPHHSEVAMFVARDTAMTKRIQELEAALVHAGISIPGPSGLNAPPPERSPSQENEGRAKRQRTSSTSDSGATSSPREASSSVHMPMPPVDTTDVTLGFGTLTIDVENRSRYVGPSGGAAYLNADLWKMNPNQAHSRGSSVDNPSSSSSYDAAARGAVDSSVSPRRVSQLEGEILAKMACLPPHDEAVRIARLYFKNASFMYEIIPEAIFFSVHLPTIYPDATHPYLPPNLHVLALAGMVLSLGTFFDLSAPVDATVRARASAFYDLAVAALDLSIPLKVDTIPAVQALHLMTLYFLSTKAESGGDPAWQLLGMAMRSIQAQGCHRDGSRWGLPPRELEERRRVFWETHIYDRLQSFTFGRPYAQSDSHHDCEIPRSCDTPLPSDTDPSNSTFSHTRWHFHKFRFALLLGRIVDLVFSVKAPPYSVIMQLDREINAHYDALPAWIICEGVKNPVKALPLGRGAGREEDMRKDAQIASLANMYYLTLLHLHRGPFCRALMLGPKNLASSRYSTSVVSLTNAARAIINIARGLFALHPAITSRMWYWIFHSFTAAVCQAVLVIVAPGHPLSPAAFESMQAAVELFERADGERAKAAAVRAGWLAERARQAMDAYRSNPATTTLGHAHGQAAAATAAPRTGHGHGDSHSPPSKLEFPTSNMRGGPEDLLGTSTKLIRAQPQGDATQQQLPSPSALLAGVLPTQGSPLHTTTGSGAISSGSGSGGQFFDRRQEDGGGGYTRGGGGGGGQAHWPPSQGSSLPLHESPAAPRGMEMNWTQDFGYAQQQQQHQQQHSNGAPHNNGGGDPRFAHQQDPLGLPFPQFQQQQPHQQQPPPIFNPSAYISVDGFDLSGFIQNGANAWLFEGAERAGEEELPRQQQWAEHMQ
ncbi:fungal-specific transcription factor domain-containing protein [Mycena filopes]|nr:fungal-specific transcription factor domain-containing protein [Mycena filopes]